MILHEKDGDKRTLKLSETRRLQNKLSQKRWRERRKQEKRIRKLNGGEEQDGKHLVPFLQANKPTLSSTPPHHHERDGGVDASDMIDALALPNEVQREEQSKEDDNPAMTTSLRNIDPQKLSLSQLLSLAYCSPVCSFQPFCQSLHFAKMFVQNANRFGFDLKFIGNSKSESYIAQDWYRHLEKEGKSPHRLAQQLLHEAPPTPSTSIRTSETISSTSTETHHPTLLWDRIPDNMHPTEEQLQIKHHPYIDVSFPWPSMRSKLIKMLYTAKVIDYNDFCDACFKAGLAGSETQQSAFFIWSDDSMDPCAWEVGEEFAKKWWFLLDDEIIKRTNWWRRMRGLPQLSVGRNVSMQEEWTV